jgi:hypothetical protein
MYQGPKCCKCWNKKIVTQCIVYNTRFFMDLFRPQFRNYEIPQEPIIPLSLENYQHDHFSSSFDRYHDHHFEGQKIDIYFLEQEPWNILQVYDDEIDRYLGNFDLETFPRGEMSDNNSLDFDFDDLMRDNTLEDRHPSSEMSDYHSDDFRRMDNFVDHDNECWQSIAESQRIIRPVLAQVVSETRMVPNSCQIVHDSTNDNRIQMATIVPKTSNCHLWSDDEKKLLKKVVKKYKGYNRQDIAKIFLAHSQGPKRSVSAVLSQMQYV